MVHPYFHLKTCCIVNNNKYITDKAVPDKLEWCVHSIGKAAPKIQRLQTLQTLTSARGAGEGVVLAKTAWTR